ncbi:MAG: hypothetical protein ABEN55_00960, partial [Bradymonadaceae bacterium]
LRNPLRTMQDAHRNALDEATAQNERWETLAGHLYDPEARDGDVCPDAIVEFVAERYVFTSHGRMFYLKANGEVSERSSSGGRFDITVDGVRWHPRQSALMRRIFPSELTDDVELPEEIDHDDERPDWLGNLQPKTRPEGSRVVHRGVSHT